ncbi:MAG TPA: indolepyruvate ferredoxin oxidoreductase family protein [Solirubrobacteraceae bacterium]|jgi:indolepyruvate ferredoxin oxidoreductase|nr:indolepyruvate ferredoxin oxidoreductase family protein [Solirubrobacteraceae bacterium]
MSTATPLRELTLEDRYTAESGSIMLDGMQALVRLMLDLRRLDTRRGYNTGVFVSGYPGSPIGGLDIELQRASRHLEPAGIVFRPGLNEELAATAVGGTQLLGELPGATKQGVTGFWYGKAPGLDRASDAIRHGNLSGTAPLGGVVAFVGDDPMAKSSTVPGSSEQTCRALWMPILAPSTISELLELGQHAVEISRQAGVWSALKIVTDLADSAGVAEAGAALDVVPALTPREPHSPPVLLSPTNLDAERDLFTARLERVREYALTVGLNRVWFEPRQPRVGVIAAGMSHQSVLRALSDLGLEREDWEALGLRLVQISMPWPLDFSQLRAFADGLETVLVVEDKLPFVEAQLKEALYRVPRGPWVLGKQDAEGRELLQVSSAVGADDVARALARILPSAGAPDGLVAHMRAAVADRSDPLDRIALETKRTPYFCSGCPHNTSTRMGGEQLIGVGIGCHTMVALEPHDRRGHVLGMPQMGGEGAQWLGLEPFATESHFTQNLGDGTFHHSGSLAIRAAIAGGVNITYRLLYNDAVAMTGGQQPQGKMTVPNIVSELSAEGVSRIVITTPEPERYAGVSLPAIAAVRHRDDIGEVQAELAAVAGVTVLIHDDRCATEKRRMRKRGVLETPPERVFINERVCEGCGDCGEKSSCLSVQPVQTEFGRKTRIHQSSCNLDMSCVKGDCPSFLVVERVTPRAKAQAPMPPADLPEPTLRVPVDALIRMPGVGGTGVVTAAAILRTAAHLEGRYAAALDQTGLAQKGGPVISDLRLASTPITGQLRASRGGVDVLLGFDLLGAVAPQTVAVLNTERTVAVLNTDVSPTASMVMDTSVAAPEPERLVTRVRRMTRDADALAIPAETLAEQLFGSHLQANMLLIGAAYQQGCLPLRADAIERAIELNGASAEANIAAFRWGRAVVARPELVAKHAGASVGEPHAGALRELSLADRLERNERELTAYQDASYASGYGADVQSVAAIVQERLGAGGMELANAYADGLFKLMAYKDEYEVARLHLDAVERARLEAEFGKDARVKVLLHPPLLRAMGMKRKLRLGRSVVPLFRSLRAARRLRGTALDPFGRTAIRRLERALIEEYRLLVARALDSLAPATASVVLQIVLLPDMVRGYEEIKVGNVERMRERAQELLRQLDAPAAGDAELELIPAHH